MNMNYTVFPASRFQKIVVKNGYTFEVPCFSWRYGHEDHFFSSSNDEISIFQYYGSSPSRVGDFGLISYRVEHAGEDFQAQVLLVA